MSSHIYYQKEGAIATIIIDRPEKKNCFSIAMYTELHRILEELEEDLSIKVLIVRGVDETAFSAGADITEFLDARFDTDKAKNYNDIALNAIEKLYRFPRPTIALIRKIAIGGGLELANSCDFRFATSNTRVGIPSANIGIVYNLTSTKRLYNLIGPSKTKEMVYTAKLFSAEEAKEFGLLDYVHEEEDIVKEVLELANLIISKSSVANAGIKKVIQSIVDGENEESEEIASMILESFSSDDYKEGIDAFLNKRKVNFK